MLPGRQIGTFLAKEITLMQAHCKKRAMPQKPKSMCGPPCNAQDEHMQPTSRVTHQKIQSKPALPPHEEDKDIQNPFDCDEDEDGLLANHPEGDSAHKCGFLAENHTDTFCPSLRCT